MERLLEDAEKLSGIHYDISNYADIIEAIHVIQTEMGITGTTAKEASETIEGSANAAKAAWQNLLTGFGRNDADLDKLVDEVIDSVTTLGKNVLPVAERAFTSLMKTATREGAKLAKQIPGFIDDAAEHIHQTIADEFGATADQIFAVETAIKAAAAGFVTYKAAMVASDVVEGVVTLTKVIQGATTAQEALNAAGMANPYVLLATAIATATVALKSYIDTQTDLLDEAGDTYNTLTDDQKAFLESSDELYKSISGNIKAANDEIKSVDKQVGALQSMTDELYKLNDAENLSNEQKDKMKMLVNSLNDAIPALNLELDKETGHLKNQKSTIDELIESYGKQAKAQAAQQRLVKLHEDQLEAEENLKRVEKERADARAKYDQLLWKSYQLQSQMRKEANSEDGSVERYNALADELAGVNAQLELQKNSLGDLNGVFVSASESVNSLNGSIKDTENIAAEAAGATDLLAENTEENTTKMTTAMTNQQRVAKALANNLKDYVVSVGGETYNISQSTLEDIQEISKEYHEALQAQEDNIRGSLDLFSEFNGGAETSSKELINNLWNNAAELENWANNLASLADRGINQGLLNELEEAGPSSASKVKAMTQMSDTELKNYSAKWEETQIKIHEIAEKQTEDVKSSAENQIAAILGVKTDNEEFVKKSYEDLGNLIVGGIGDNVVDGTNKYVVPVTEEMVHKMNTAAQTALAEGDYPGKGENIDKGIAEGIERGEHWTSDAIHKLVHDIEQTYMQDTDSHSPSKLFKKLAGYIPQGMAEGIENGKKDVVNAMGDVLNAVEDVMTDGKSRRGLIEINPPSRKGLVKLDPDKYKKNGDGSLLTLEPPKGDSDSGSGGRSRSRSYSNDYGGYGYSIERPLTINLVLKNGEAFARFVAPYLDLINAESVTLQQLGAAW